MPAMLWSSVVAVEQVALLAPSAGIADHARGAAGERVGPMAGELEAAQRDLTEQVADVEAVGRRIEPDVDTDGTGRQASGQRGPVGRVLHEAAGLELGEQVGRRGHGAVMVA